MACQATSTDTSMHDILPTTALIPAATGLRMQAQQQGNISQLTWDPHGDMPHRKVASSAHTNPNTYRKVCMANIPRHTTNPTQTTMLQYLHGKYYIPVGMCNCEQGRDNYPCLPLNPRYYSTNKHTDGACSCAALAGVDELRCLAQSHGYK